MTHEVFLSNSQIALKDACFRAYQKKCRMIIETPHGAGLEFSLRSLVRNHPHIKLVHVDCLTSASIRTIFVRLLRDAMNVKFSNLNYFHISLENLMRIVSDRMNRDLRKEQVLIIVDHIDVLKIPQLEYLVKLLHFRNPQCAIVLRSTSEHRLKLSEKGTRLHDDLYINLAKERVAIEANSVDDMRIFIRDIHQIQDEEFIKDLAKKKWGFSKTLAFIDRYKDRGGK